MISRKTAIGIANFSETLVFNNVAQVGQMIILHSQLGFYEMEIFVDNKALKKCIKALEKKKYYYRVFKFKSLPNESKLYVSWLSNL